MPGHFNHHTSSYRDPSGFIFIKDEKLYRQVNRVYSEHFDFFIDGGLYDHLARKGWIIPHKRINENLTGAPEWYATLQPESINYISYPYEWSFGMLKDAALLTLDILSESIEHKMILKDASPYNIQWHKGRLVFIDTLSFEKYDETKPWIAYRQFCEHFLSPLLLAHYSGMPVQELLLAYSDGIPLPITKSFLPWRSRFSLDTYLHIHLHAKYSQRALDAAPAKTPGFSKKKLLRLIASLRSLVNKMQLPANKTTWSGYYEEAAGRNDYLEQKQQLIKKWVERIQPSTAADLGANRGAFSKIIAGQDVPTIAADFDAHCIHSLYETIKATGDTKMLPLVVDLSRPSPAIGVNNEERQSFIQRTNVDLILALALVHHLAIGRNIPLPMIANFFNRMCRHLIIEFVPKTDEKLQLMLQQKQDIYSDYTQQAFVEAFSKYFTIEDKQLIGGSGRTLYFMQIKVKN